MHVLVVEDDAASRRALVKILKQGGHTTAEAWTTAGALRILAAESVDVVLLDIDLGEGRRHAGYKVAEVMGSDDKWEHIPIIVVSGLEVSDIRGGAAPPPTANPLAGVDFIVSKPIEGAKLLRILEHLKPI